MQTQLQSVTNGNIDRFMDLLERADNHPDRLRFQRLLIAEEDRFGIEEHRRESLQRCLMTVTIKIEEQTRIIEGIRARGGDLVEAEALMGNLLIIRTTLRNIRARWQIGN